MKFNKKIMGLAVGLACATMMTAPAQACEFGAMGDAKYTTSDDDTVSSSFAIIWVQTPVSFSPLITAHWIGAGPRYLGSREACTLIVPKRGKASTFSGNIFPKAITIRKSGLSSETKLEKSVVLIDAGCNTRYPKSCARAFTAGGASLRPLPRGRSGWVTTIAIS